MSPPRLPESSESTPLPSPSDQADLALTDLREKLSQKPDSAPKKSLASLLGATALLGLTGLGIFQGAAPAQATPAPLETEMVSESQLDLTSNPGVLAQVETSPQMVVAGRQGRLLGPGKILKFDQFPGMHREHLQETIPGAPNFRQVEGTNVYGVAQPTIDGLRSVLDRTGAKEKTVVWTNMREEPVLYINGRSYSLREEAHPFENSADFTGVNETQIEQTEMQLKAEVLAEARANGGRMLLHTENADGVTSEWVDIGPGSVKTPREVYQQLQGEGYKVDFARVPVTDEKAPENGDLQAIVDRVTSAEDGAALIFNCHAGRGRTTTAMVAAQLLQRAQNPESVPFQRLEAVRRDIREQGHYDQGNYRLIISLIQHLDSGVSAKTETDEILDMTQHIQNLRRDINRYRDKSLQADNEASASRAEARGLDYLERYHKLITFNEYVKEQTPKGFEVTFQQWLDARPELTKMLETIQLSQNDTIPQPAGMTGEAQAQYA